MGRRQAVGSNALYTYTRTNAHRNASHGNEDNLLQKSYTQPGVRFAEAGDMCVEDPVLPGSLGTQRVSQWMSTAAKRSIPEKGPVWAVTALLFSSCISDSLLPARFKWKAPENRR